MSAASLGARDAGRHRAALRALATRAARLFARYGLDGPLLSAVAGVLRWAPRLRLVRSAGWHLAQAAGDRPHVARLRSGSRMVVDVRDYAHRHIFLSSVYEEELTYFITRISYPGWTVLDVGANAGYFSLLAADLGGPKSRVVAFEPNPQMVSLLHRSLAMNPLAPVEIVEAACGDHEGRVSLSLSPDPHNNGLSTVREAWVDAQRVSVALLRLDDFCISRRLRPDLVKIDVEGAEADVLFGAEALLRHGYPRHVICEVWSASRNVLIEYMGRLGYLPHDIRSDGSLVPAATTTAPWHNLCFRHEPAEWRA